jgi:hypothetical protein
MVGSVGEVGLGEFTVVILPTNDGRKVKSKYLGLGM